MIKSDFGTVEVNGTKLVIMAEFETLLVALRGVLGEKEYNLVLQDANKKELIEKGKETSRNGKKVIKAALSEKEDK